MWEGFSWQEARDLQKNQILRLTSIFSSDRAHCISPAGGQGANTALQDAAGDFFFSQRNFGPEMLYTVQPRMEALTLSQKARISLSSHDV